MGLVTAQTFVQQLLDGLVIPGPAQVGTLQAVITPYDPDDQGLPMAYVWPSEGTERRQSIPRNIGGMNGGWKTIHHSLDVWLTWFTATDDEYADEAFPSLVDAVMTVLRTCADPAKATDPNTGAVSWLTGIGEDMTYRLHTVRAVEDQRINRYDALCVVPFSEFIQF